MELPRYESGTHLDGATLGPPPLVPQHGARSAGPGGVAFGVASYVAIKGRSPRYQAICGEISPMSG